MSQDIDFTILSNEEARNAISVLIQNTSMPLNVQNWGIDFITNLEEERLTILKGVITYLIKAAQERDLDEIRNQLQIVGIPKIMSVMIAPKILQSVDALENGETINMIIPPSLLRIINVNPKQ